MTQILGPFNEDYYAMSIPEIAEALGMCESNVEAALKSGLEKIRRRPETLRKFKELVEMRRKLMNRRAENEEALGQNWRETL